MPISRVFWTKYNCPRIFHFYGFNPFFQVRCYPGIVGVICAFKNIDIVGFYKVKVAIKCQFE